MLVLLCVIHLHPFPPDLKRMSLPNMRVSSPTSTTTVTTSSFTSCRKSFVKHHPLLPSNTSSCNSTTTIPHSIASCSPCETSLTSCCTSDLSSSMSVSTISRPLQHDHRRQHRRPPLNLSTSCSSSTHPNLCRRRPSPTTSSSPAACATTRLSSMSVLITCFLLLMFSLIPGSLSQGVCPSKCNCIWRNGKQTTVCESQGLISIPSGIAQQTQVLNLNQNNFQILPAKVFQERGLINLQKVFLSRCKLGVIAEDAFVQLTNLVELDLSSNVLTSVPSDSLKHCPNLRRLVLNNNPIGAIRKETFANTPALNSLDLSECQIGSVEAGSFKGLSSLQYLKLDGNRLSTLSSLVLQDLPPLYSMDLHKNPWNCDCQLRPAREWMIRYNVPQSIPPTCAGPDKRSGMMWNSLELDEFACSPQILSRDTEITAMIASNASFTCITRAQPEAKVSWLIEDVIYRNLSSSASASPLALKQGERFSFTEDRSAGPSLVSSTLTITSLEAGDSGKTFVCYAENFAGVASKSFTISVLSLSGTVVGGWSKFEVAVAIVSALVVLLSVFIAITIFIVRSRRFKDCNSSTGSTAKPTPIVHASDHSSKASIPQIDVLKNVPSHGTPSPLGSKEILESNGHIVNFNNFSSGLHHYNSRDDILNDHHLTYGNNTVVDFNHHHMDPVTGYLQHQQHLQQQHQLMQQQMLPDHHHLQQTVSPSQQMFSSAMMNGDAIHHSVMFQNNGFMSSSGGGNGSSSTGSSNPPTSSSSHFDTAALFAGSMGMSDVVPESNIPVSGTCVICEQPFADLRFHYMDYHQVRECIV